MGKSTQLRKMIGVPKALTMLRLWLRRVNAKQQQQQRSNAPPNTIARWPSSLSQHCSALGGASRRGARVGLPRGSVR